MDSEGGYLAPDEYERTLIASSGGTEHLPPAWPMSSTPPPATARSPSWPSKGTAVWIDEEAALSRKRRCCSARCPSARTSWRTMLKVSEELLNDSVFDLPSYIAREFARRIGAAEEEAFFTGDGTRQGHWASSRPPAAPRPASPPPAPPPLPPDELIDLFYSLRSALPPQRRVAS
ncbi:MAG: phage major capsid protein [Dysosmobacter sp.]